MLKRKISYLLDKARLQSIRTGEKARLFDDVYYAAGSWDEPRRVVMKAEWLAKGGNPRFVVTNLLTPAEELYDKFYVQRGASSEHPIKELKLLPKLRFRLDEYWWSWLVIVPLLMKSVLLQDDCQVNLY